MKSARKILKGTLERKPVPPEFCGDHLPKKVGLDAGCVEAHCSDKIEISSISR
jgi:hypothetical protein